MSYTLIIGNNFISNNPRTVRYNDKILFIVDRKENARSPTISLNLSDNNGTVLIKVENNVCNHYDPKLTMKKSDKDHILITDNSGEIILESRVLDSKSILVSGVFYVDMTTKITITQNYIILPSGKWIMHDRINANNSDVTISDNGITVIGG